MRSNIIAVAMFAATMVAYAADGGECRYFRYPKLSVGHDDDEYIVRAVPGLAAGGRVDRGAPVENVGDALSQAAGVSVIYLSRETQAPVPDQEWRGSDPLSALRSFAEAAGLQVVMPSPGWWVVGTVEHLRSDSIEVTAHPVVPEQRCLLSSGDEIMLEDQLVRQLPIRDNGDLYGRTSIDLAYYWLSSRAPDELLVQVRVGNADAPQCGATSFRLFKLRVSRRRGGFVFDCLWSTDMARGRLVSEIADDLDGDGVRDFVFDDPGCDGFESPIVSGGDGRILFEFTGSAVAVEETPKGPKRLAVPFSFGVGDGKYLPPGVRASEIPKADPLLLRYDQRGQRFEVDVNDEARVRASMTGDVSQGRPEELRRWLGALVGSPDRVHLFKFGVGARPKWPEPGTTVCRVVCWRPRPDAATGFQPPEYQSRVVFEFKGRSVDSEPHADGHR